MKLQEKLMADMEKALSKRELIGMKGRAATSRKEGAGEVTRQQQERAASDLQRSVKDTKRECQVPTPHLPNTCPFLSCDLLCVYVLSQSCYMRQGCPTTMRAATSGCGRNAPTTCLHVPMLKWDEIRSCSRQCIGRGEVIHEVAYSRRCGVKPK
jgi:hypothetical protein